MCDCRHCNETQKESERGMDMVYDRVDFERLRALEGRLDAKWDDEYGWLLPFYLPGDRFLLIPLGLWIKERKAAAERDAVTWKKVEGEDNG